MSVFAASLYIKNKLNLVVNKLNSIVVHVVDTV